MATNEKFTSYQDYWIYSQFLIFKPHFNNKLCVDELLQVAKFKYLIFSNYNCPKICIQYDNTTNYHLIKKFKTHLFYNRSNFNQLMKLPNSLVYLNLGHQFNQPIDLTSNQNLKFLILGDCFNHSILLNNNLEKLSFGNDFNQSINLPTNLLKLFFGNDFDKKIILNEKLTHLSFNYWGLFNQPIEITPSIIYLNLPLHFNQPLEFNNNNVLTYLSLGEAFNQELFLPPSVKYLKINSNINIIDF